MNLYFLKDIYKPKSLKPFFGVLDEFEYLFRNYNQAITTVIDIIEKDLYANASNYEDELYESGNPRLHMLIALNNISFRLISSGTYHIFRGILQTGGDAEGLMYMFNYSCDELVHLKHWNKSDAKIARKNLNENIAMVG